MVIKSKNLKIPKPQPYINFESQPSIFSSLNIAKSLDDKILKANPKHLKRIETNDTDYGPIGDNYRMKDKPLMDSKQSKNRILHHAFSFDTIFWNKGKGMDYIKARIFSIQSIGIVFRQLSNGFNEYNAHTSIETCNQSRSQPPTNIIIEDSVFTQNGNLFVLLNDIFANSNLLNNDIKPTLKEIHILNAVLHKKFHKCLEMEDLQQPYNTILAKFQSIITFSTSKRPEEYYKYLLSKAIKHMKAEFSSRFKIKKVQLDKFYRFYFGDIAVEKNLPIEAFYFPSKSKKQKEKNMLNSKYFRLIFKSDRFVDAVQRYIKDDLIQHHREDVTKKLKNILMKLNSVFNTFSSQYFYDTNVLGNKLFSSKHTKLPWTLTEIQTAVCWVTDLVETYK